MLDPWMSSISGRFKRLPSSIAVLLEGSLSNSSNLESLSSDMFCSSSSSVISAVLGSIGLSSLSNSSSVTKLSF